MSLPRLPVSIMLSYELGSHSLKPLSVASFSYLWTPGGGEDLFPGCVGKARPRTQSSWSRVHRPPGRLPPPTLPLASLGVFCVFLKQRLALGWERRSDTQAAKPRRVPWRFSLHSVLSHVIPAGWSSGVIVPYKRPKFLTECLQVLIPS